MSDKLLLNYKGNLDVSDIPGALTGSKVSYIQKIQGRDYMKVHDIPGAIPKLNVGYTGHRRLDEEEYRGSSNERQLNNQTELIGRPQLKPRNQEQNGGGHQRGLSENFQAAHGNYRAVNAQQIDHQQLYSSFKMQEPPIKSDMNTPYQLHQSSVPKLNFQEQQQQQQQQQKQNSYVDALDKFMTERDNNQSNMTHNKKKQLQLEQDTYQRSLSILDTQTPRQGPSDFLNSGGLLSSRTSQVTKSTANLILKPKQDDLYSTMNNTQRKPQVLQQTKGDYSPKNLQESPHQVQKKIKGVQSSFVYGDELGGTSTNYLDQLSSQKQASDMLKASIKKGGNNNHNLFNINASTVPDAGKFSVNEQRGSVKRSLCLAPSTQLGQHHKEEIDESIQQREYTKLGGGNTNVQMPNDLNNIQYHRKNPLKDYTYSALTGAYYYKAPN